MPVNACIVAYVKDKLQNYTVKLPVELIRKLNARKKEIGIPASEQIRRAIEEYLAANK